MAGSHAGRTSPCASDALYCLCLFPPACRPARSTGSQHPAAAKYRLLLGVCIVPGREPTGIRHSVGGGEEKSLGTFTKFARRAGTFRNSRCILSLLVARQPVARLLRRGKAKEDPGERRSSAGDLR